MSELITPKHTLVDSIPLGRRISEIMTERGSAYSISAMAKRLDINRETYRLMLKGEREIYTFELEKIAQDLKISVERILQADIVEKRQQLKKMLVDLTNLPNLIELSEDLLESAIGLSEKCIALNNVGSSCYWNAGVHRALEVWLTSWPLVKECYEKYDEDEWLKRVAGNLMMSYSDSNQHAKFKEVFIYIEPLFERFPDLSAVAYNCLGKFHLLQGNLEESKKNRLLSLHYSMKTTNHLRTAKFKFNVALAEYRIKNYLTSKEMLESIIEYVNTCSDPYFISIVYHQTAKTLLRMKEFNKAKHSLQKAIGIMNPLVKRGYEGLETELYFLLAITYNDPVYAKNIVHNDEIHIQVRKLACKFLIDHYERTGDLAAKETYQTFYNQRHAAIDMLLEDRVFSIDDYLNFYEFCDILGWNKPSSI